MAEKPSIVGIGALSADYEEALSLCGLVDDVKNPSLLEPRPYRYAEGESICRPGDPVDCLWIIVNGSIAVKQQDQTLFVRRRNEVVGEQHLVGNGYQRIYDLVASESNVEVLVVDKAKIKAHPESGVIWRNIAKNHFDQAQKRKPENGITRSSTCGRYPHSPCLHEPICTRPADAVRWREPD